MAETKAYVVVLAINIIYTGMFLLTKATIDVGMNFSIFVFYRQAFATIFLLPIAFLLERKIAPPFSFIVFIKIFFLALVGVTGTFNIYGVGLQYTSASLVAASTNSLPVITFFLALIFRMEKVDLLRTRASVWKLVGVVLCLIGVVIIAFYKGPSWTISSHNIFNHHTQQVDNHVTHHSNSKTWIIGVFVTLLSNTTWALWLVLQGPILRNYPSKLIFTTSTCFFSAVQSFVVAILVEPNLSEWKLGWNVRLLSAVYCGVVVTGMAFYLQTWLIEKKGPFFLAMTSPLSWIFTLVCSTLMLGEIISLGSVLGAILLVGALYCEVWSRYKEQKMNKKEASSIAETSMHESDRTIQV